MAATNHQLAFGPMEAKALVPMRTNSGPSDGQALVPERTNGLSLLVAAVSETCTEKDAAISLGLPDQSYWSKVKSGDKPAPRIDRLTELPIGTQRTMAERWARQLGLRVIAEDDERRAALELAESALRYLRLRA